jgi:hypothetical protein
MDGDAIQEDNEVNYSHTKHAETNTLHKARNV